MSNADVIIEILAEEGVEYLAGFPNNRLFNSAAAHSIRPIIARTERVAINMADAYTRMNNGKKIGVIAVQDGPGIEARHLTDDVLGRCLDSLYEVGVCELYQVIAEQVVGRLGLGESESEIREALEDLRAIDLNIVTLGQYLRPTKNHLAVERYVSPEEFEQYRKWGLELGFLEVVAGPLVRSSYRADRVLEMNNVGL